jgi:HK97 family phage portal protein
MNLKNLFKRKNKNIENTVQKDFNNENSIIIIDGLTNKSARLFSPATLEKCYKGIVSTCIDLKSKYAASGKPMILKRINQTKSEPLLKHQFLRLLDSPNQYMNGHELKMKTFQNLEIYGNAYWLITKGYLGLPDSIWILPSRDTDLKYDNKGVPSHYEYNNSYTGIIKYNLNDIVHIRYSNPFSLYQGMSTIQKAYSQILIDQEMTTYQLNLLFNDGSPKGVLQSDKNLNVQQGEEALKLWNKSNQGSKNAGKTGILTNGLKYNSVGTNNKDLDYVESKKYFKNEIMNIFGVHVGLLDAENVNKANVHGAIVIFNHMIINEMLDHLSSALSQYISKTYSNDLFIQFELELPDDPIEIRADYKLQYDIASSMGNQYILKKILDDFRNYCDNDTIPDNLLNNTDSNNNTNNQNTEPNTTTNINE